ncbi:MAG: glycosyltransferase family 2 protein [Acidimicrobiales bacterium]
MSATVTVCVASFNTCAATELCVRSMRRFAGYPYALRVGDGGSTDGSVAVLEDLEQRGWLLLEHSAERRRHADWLDNWRQTCDSDLLLFVDSDIEFRRPGWLRRIVGPALLECAAIAYAEWQPAQWYTVDGRAARVLGRPAPWLLLIDAKLVSAVRAGFTETHSETVPASPTLIVRDVGSAFFEEAIQHDLHTLKMPSSYRRVYHHYGGLSWLPTTGARGRKKLRDERVVKRRLEGMRRVQDGSSELVRLLATAQLAATIQEARDLAFRVTSRVVRSVRRSRDH